MPVLVATFAEWKLGLDITPSAYNRRTEDMFALCSASKFLCAEDVPPLDKLYCPLRGCILWTGK